MRADVPTSVIGPRSSTRCGAGASTSSICTASTSTPTCRRAGPPVLATLHLPPDWYPPEVFEPARPDTFLHCVSASQRARCPPGARLLPEVPNGVAGRRRWPRATPSAASRSPSAASVRRKAFTSRWTRPGARAWRSCSPARSSATAAHETYFAREIVPRLDARRRFLGPIGFAPQAAAADRGALPARAQPRAGDQLAGRDGSARLRHAGDRLPGGRPARDRRARPDRVPRARRARDGGGDRMPPRRSIPRVCRAGGPLALRARADESSATSRSTASLRASPVRRTLPATSCCLSLHDRDGHDDRGSRGARRRSGAELWRRAPAATPFQAPAWLIPWWRHFGNGELRRPDRARGRAAGRTAAALPAARAGWHEAPAARHRRLGLSGRHVRGGQRAGRRRCIPPASGGRTLRLEGLRAAPAAPRAHRCWRPPTRAAGRPRSSHSSPVRASRFPRARGI